MSSRMCVGKRWTFQATIVTRERMIPPSYRYYDTDTLKCDPILIQIPILAMTTHALNVQYDVVLHFYCNLVSRRWSGAIEGCCMEQLVGQRCVGLTDTAVCCWQAEI